MPFDAIMVIVSILMVIGIISITEAIIRIIIKGKNPPDTVLIRIADKTDGLDMIVREIIKKYPFSKIQIDQSSDDIELKNTLEILKKDYPNIKINPPE